MKGQGHRHFPHKFWIIPSRQHVINAPTVCTPNETLGSGSQRTEVLWTSSVVYTCTWWDVVQQAPEMFFSGSGKDVAKGLNTHKLFKWLEHLEVGPVSISVMSTRCLSCGELFSVYFISRLPGKAELVSLDKWIKLYIKCFDVIAQLGERFFSFLIFFKCFFF